MLTVDIERLPSSNRGLEKGINKGIEKVAIGMLKLNLDIDIIQKTTGLSVEKIERLKRTISSQYSCINSSPNSSNTYLLHQ